MSLPGFDFACGVEVTNAEQTLAFAGERNTEFWWASVTKPFASWAMLTELERGNISLDDPLGPEGATLRHMMSHASGIDFASTHQIMPVGTRRIYSNKSIEIAGDYCAQAAGMSITDLIRKRVAEPLGMDSWRFEGSPARDGYSNLEDLAKFAREVLNPTLISKETRDMALAVHFPELDGVLPGYGSQHPNPWGLGFEIRGDKNPHWSAPDASPKLAGHFGRAGSFLWVDLELGLAACFLGAENFNEQHLRNWPTLNHQILQNFAK